MSSADAPPTNPDPITDSTPVPDQASSIEATPSDNPFDSADSQNLSPWSPDVLFTSPAIHALVRSHLQRNDFRSAIITCFSLPPNDSYAYRATTAVTLAQVQSAIEAGNANNLHDWYFTETRDDESGVVTRVATHPSSEEVAAYVSLFDPSKHAGRQLKGVRSNSKKGGLREGVMSWLEGKRFMATTDGGASNGDAVNGSGDVKVGAGKGEEVVKVAKSKKPHPNVYADFWAWSCYALEWCGPDQRTVGVKSSHHVLPVFMHHFGCVCPSFEGLGIVRGVWEMNNKEHGGLNGNMGNGVVLDVGSGNGYWTYMLRKHGVDVIAIDNGQSRWRTSWIEDTVKTDGVRYIKRERQGGKGDVLLMVYPVVGLDFTTGVLDAYKGDVVCVAGTQNGNGYTGFKGEMIDQWMKRERKDFEKIVQIPLPSFAGKDDALFIFRRKKKGSKVNGEVKKSD